MVEIASSAALISGGMTKVLSKVGWRHPVAAEEVEREVPLNRRVALQALLDTLPREESLDEDLLRLKPGCSSSCGYRHRHPPHGISTRLLARADREVASLTIKNSNRLIAFLREIEVLRGALGAA